MVISTGKKAVKTIAKPAVVFLKHAISKQKITRLVEEREIFLEVGAGNKKGSGGWITLDITKNCDIYWDLRKGIPFPDESVSKIYSSHFMEHLSYQEGQRFLDECVRVLIPGGTFSVCVPNARLYLEAYVNADTSKTEFLRYAPACNNTTTIDFVNYTAYMDGEHKYMFDQENLIHILKFKGFQNVHQRAFDPSLDLKERDFESIYAEATKPLHV